MSGNKKRKLNIQRVLLVGLPLLILICILGSVLALFLWNNRNDLPDYENDPTVVKPDPDDHVTVLPASLFHPETDDGVTTILVFGNDSYYEGVNDGTSVTDLIPDAIDKYIADNPDEEIDVPNYEIINCCLPGSTLVAQNTASAGPEVCPEDYFTVFWLCISTKFNDFNTQREALKYLDSSKYDVPLYSSVIDTLESVDLSKIDLILFCYDGHDYLNGALGQKDPLNEDTMNDVTTVFGAVYDSVFVLTDGFPDIQYVFVSPAFCYAFDEKGKKQDCTIYDTGNGNISKTLNSAKGVMDVAGISYMDFIVGVDINEANGDKYLKDDGITPNLEGRKMMAYRLVELLIYRL